VTKEQLIIEVTKCVRNTPYALKTYLQTYDNTVSKYVPLDLFPDQVSLIEDYEKYNENIALKYRQAGVSTVTAAWASKKLVFAKKQKPEKVLIIANKLDTSVEMANKIRSFTEQWPSWVGVGFSDFWSACMASLSTGGKVIVVSTPNGYDPIYYEIYDQALRNMNDFKISEMFWYRDPRYTRDLYMVKTTDLVHYLLNREEYKDDVVIDLSTDKPYERDHSIVTEYIKQGYKPCSSWFEGMVKKLKYDRRKVAQELECNFLGSGDNVFESEVLQNISQNTLQEPGAKLMGGSLWIWKEPVVGHKYVMGVDVSRGDSEDFSCIEIIDFDENEQVLEYVAKVPPDVVAEIAYKWGTMYDAFCVVDLTGGMGVATARKLQELNYKGLYVDTTESTNKWKWDPKLNEKIPGINFNSKRVQIIASFEEVVRHGFKVRSTRLYNEMNTFVYINGRPDHQKGHHDDCIMGISMATYVAEKSFQQLTKNVNHTKAMINSWSTSVNENKNSSQFFNPMMPQTDQKRQYFPNQGPARDDYEKYRWLFC